MRCGQRHTNRRTEVYACFLQQLLQTRKPYICAPVSDVKGLLRLINMPALSLLDWHAKARKLSIARYAPFNLIGILFEDNHVEIIKTEQFAQLISENS